MTRSRASAIALLTAALCAPAGRAQTPPPAEVVTWTSGVSYAYDGSGNVQQIGKDTFVYDHVGRLVRATVNGVTRNYEYDAYGNRTKCIQGAGTASVSDCQGYTIRPSDNQIAEAGYDPNGSGNLTSIAGHTYSYDPFNMLSRDQFGDPREFIYTASDERVAIYTSGAKSWQWTVRDMGNQPLREFTSSGGAHGTGSFEWTKDYIWRDSLLLASVQPVGTFNATYHYHLDHQGTPRRITDANDNLVGFHDYFTFGPEALGHNEPSVTKIKYTGHERDSAGDAFGTLDYMHARYYHPGLGRFTTVDPARSGRANVPQSWNRYAYTLNNPVRYIDPNGLAEVSLHVYAAPARNNYTKLDFVARLFGGSDRMALAGHHSFQYTDGNWAKEDLKRSLAVPGSFVVYYGHAGFSGRTALGLDPVGQQRRGDLITTKQLTQMLSTAKSSVVLITGCSSAACVSPGMKSTAGAIVAIQPTGDKGTFSSSNFSARATDVFVSKMLGTQTGSLEINDPATVGEAINAANEELIATGQEYRFVLIWGSLDIKLEPDK